MRGGVSTHFLKRTQSTMGGVTYLFRQRSILLEELHDAVGELGMVHAQTLHLVKRDQDSCEEEFMLLLQGESEAVDDGAQYLEQLSNAVESLGFVGELEEDVVDGTTDEGPEVEEFAVYAMQGRLQEVPFPRILGVEQLEKLKHKAVVDVRLGDVCVEVLAFDEAKEELVHDLDMRPGNFQHGLVLFGIERLALRVHGRRNRAEQVLGEHADDDRVHGLRDDLSVIGHIVQELMESQALDFLGFHVGACVVEVEDDVALLDLLHEEIFPTSGGNLVEARQLF